MSAAIEFLRDIAEKLQHQDNIYTASPNYCIQENRLITGIDTDYTDNIGWFDQENDYQQADEKKHKALERYYDRYNREPNGWTRTGYEFKWRYTGMSFLTKDAADAYVASQNHRHEYPISVYVESHYRNREMREVRRLLAGPVAACVESLRAVISECGGSLHPATYEAALTALTSLDTAKEPHQ